MLYDPNRYTINELKCLCDELDNATNTLNILSSMAQEQKDIDTAILLQKARAVVLREFVAIMEARYKRITQN